MLLKSQRKALLLVSISLAGQRNTLHSSRCCLHPRKPRNSRVTTSNSYDDEFELESKSVKRSNLNHAKSLADGEEALQQRMGSNSLNRNQNQENDDVSQEIEGLAEKIFMDFGLSSLEENSKSERNKMKRMAASKGKEEEEDDLEEEEEEEDGDIMKQNEKERRRKSHLHASPTSLLEEQEEDLIISHSGRNPFSSNSTDSKTSKTSESNRTTSSGISIKLLKKEDASSTSSSSSSSSTLSNNSGEDTSTSSFALPSEESSDNTKTSFSSSLESQDNTYSKEEQMSILLNKAALGVGGGADKAAREAARKINVMESLYDARHEYIEDKGDSTESIKSKVIAEKDGSVDLDWFQDMVYNVSSDVQTGKQKMEQRSGEESLEVKGDESKDLLDSSDTSNAAGNVETPIIPRWKRAQDSLLEREQQNLLQEEGASSNEVKGPITIEELFEALNSANALNINVLDVSNVCDHTTFMVICEGWNAKGCYSVSEAVRILAKGRYIATAGMPPSLQVQGVPGSKDKDKDIVVEEGEEGTWMVIDLGHIMLNVMDGRGRKWWDLDTLWSERIEAFDNKLEQSRTDTIDARKISGNGSGFGSTAENLRNTKPLNFDRVRKVNKGN